MGSGLVGAVNGQLGTRRVPALDQSAGRKALFLQTSAVTAMMECDIIMDTRDAEADAEAEGAEVGDC